MQNVKPTIGQIESLITAIGRTGKIKSDFHDFENSAYDALRNISYPQLQLLKKFVAYNQIFKLKNFLTEKGLKIKYKIPEKLDF